MRVLLCLLDIRFVFHMQNDHFSFIVDIVVFAENVTLEEGLDGGYIDLTSL